MVGPPSRTCGRRHFNRHSACAGMAIFFWQTRERSDGTRSVMTTTGWIFMISAWALILGLMGFCLYLTLKRKGIEDDDGQST